MSQGAKTIRTFCPTCQGTVNRGEGSRAERCDFCHHRSLVVTDEPETLRYSLAPSLEAASALESARHELLRRRVLSRRQLKEASFEDPTLYFIPFLWLTGTIPYLVERELRHPDMAPRVDTKVMIEDVEVFELAAEVRGWGLKGLDVGALLAKPHAPMPSPYQGTELRARGLVLAPQRSFEDGIDWVEAKLSKIGGKPGEPPPRRLAERRRVLFVPIWTVAYRLGGQRYEVHLEAIDGGMLSGRGPEDERWRVPMALAVLILPCLFLGKMARLALDGSGGNSLLASLFNPGVFGVGLLLAALALFLFLAALAFAWSLLRYEAVHVFRRGQLWSEQLGGAEQTALDRLVARVGGLLSRLIGDEKMP